MEEALIITSSVGDGKKPIVVKSPSLFRTWWTNKNLQYDFVMGTILITLNIGAMLYMKHNKIYLTAFQEFYLTICGTLYFYFGLGSCMCWFRAITNAEFYKMYSLGRVSHILGLAILHQLLNSISPSLALWFGIPSLLWFVAAFIVSLYTTWLAKVFEDFGKEFRVWWKHVNEPQVRVVYD